MTVGGTKGEVVGMICEKVHNLLVDTDIFYHLGVSFCVTRNAFNFIEIKKISQGHSSESLLFPCVIL